MKKTLIIIIFLFCLIPTNIYAIDNKEKEEIYLDNLEPIGYQMSPKFDKYNNTYTMLINDENVKDIEFKLLLENEKDEFLVEGNKNLKIGENEVIIKVFNKENKSENIYKVIITKEKAINTGLNLENYQELNVEDSKLNKKEGLAILGFCLLIIGILFYLLFIKKIKRNKFIK